MRTWLEVNGVPIGWISWTGTQAVAYSAAEGRKRFFQNLEFAERWVKATAVSVGIA